MTEENRFGKGKAIQDSLYRDEIKEMMKTLPGDFKEYVPRFLTEADFGDFYTRGGLEVKIRELLMYCVWATLGAEFQLKAHVKGSIKAGNTKEELIAAMVQCIGYVGFPKAINAINIINELTRGALYKKSCASHRKVVYCNDNQYVTIMHNSLASYELILKELRKIMDIENFYFKPVKPQMTDLELISLSIWAEYKSFDSERHLFRTLEGTYLHDKIERSVYNKRRCKLFPYIEQLRQRMVKLLNEGEDYYIVDSMPLEVCKLSRSRGSKICKDQQYGHPDRGYCASQNMHYYGYKLHAICSLKGVFQSFDISPASVHDIHYLKDIKSQISDCVLLADKGYLSSEVQLNLFESVNIKLETPLRKNQKKYKPQFYCFKKYRKRIETLFSQLCDQFMIRRNYAKSSNGFKTRILSKLTAVTTIQFLNKFLFMRNINKLKINLV